MSISDINGRQYIQPDWPAPKSIHAFSTTRVGGIHSDGFNLIATNLKKTSACDAINEQSLVDDLQLPESPRWLKQVHEGDCVQFNGKVPDSMVVADAVMSVELNQVCIVRTADCLPILLCDRQGTRIAAIHAGWRGFIAGVIENTLSAMCFSENEGLAWMGPAISQRHFELGPEVFEQFLRRYPYSERYFIVKSDRYYLDLFGLARHILEAQGIAVYGGDYCTYEREDWFYSYRRDQETGRQASLIWREAE